MKLASLISIPLLLLNAPRSAAQEEIRTKFRIVSWESGQPSEIAYISAGEPVRVDGINNSMRSPFLEYQGPRTMLLYDTSASLQGAGTADGAPEAPKPIAKVRFPKGVKYPLVLLLPNPEKDPPFRNVVFEDDPAKFPFGTYFFQNFSKRKVAADMGGERFIVEPDRSQHLISSDAKALHLRLAVSKETEDGWQMVFDSFFPNWEERRTLIFLYDTVRNGRTRMETRTLLENKAVWDAAMKADKEE